MEEGGAVSRVASVLKWGVLGVVILIMLAGVHCALWHFFGERIYEYKQKTLVDALIEVNPGLAAQWIQTEPFVNPWAWLAERDADKRKVLRSRLAFIPGIMTVHISHTRIYLVFTDLTPIRKTNIRALRVPQTTIADLSPIAGMPLTHLNIAGTNVTDLSALVGMPLTRLDLLYTQVADLSPLRGMPLEELSIHGTPAAKHPLPDWLPAECRVIK